jgi:hypothetical protein
MRARGQSVGGVSGSWICEEYIDPSAKKVLSRSVESKTYLINVIGASTKCKT